MPERLTERQIRGRYGAHKSWANTVDRSARTRQARSKSPGSIDYWLDRLDPERFANATDEQKMQAAEAGKKAHFAELSMRSAAARRKTANA